MRVIALILGCFVSLTVLSRTRAAALVPFVIPLEPPPGSVLAPTGHPAIAPDGPRLRVGRAPVDRVPPPGRPRVPAQTASTSEPMAVKKPRGVASKVMVAMIGMVVDKLRAASTASTASARSIIVSMQSASTPASMRAPS